MWRRVRPPRKSWSFPALQNLFRATSSRAKERWFWAASVTHSIRRETSTDSFTLAKINPSLFVPPKVGWHVDWPIDDSIVFSIMNASNFNASGLLMKSFWRFLNSGWFVKMLHICGFSPQAWAPSPPAVTSQECVSQDTEWGNISEAVIRLFKQPKLLFKLKVNKLV